ncbi:hypothetical protein E5Q_04738 [Mixia osmundae IAM 14324]|uniref:FAD/NAD(P)-binding domain-containing protein n=1 Tax=Mixia osmundae (strain CBS 9802 / IAM 14324 / JCM 22182 / KY 12970) TaxID=764103 RepID=G7E5E7_MIXOS|nr:hypothetical protein E5Q_04738 [Mixia osmundae IAM 14324]
MTKRICVIGYGSAGLVAVKTLQDLPIELRRDYDVVIYEGREALGGVWLPEEHIRPAPDLPMTGIYPDLRANTPVNMMTYPDLPFPKGTDLFPHHSKVLRYLQDYARIYSLEASGQTVLKASPYCSSDGSSAASRESLETGATSISSLPPQHHVQTDSATRPAQFILHPLKKSGTQWAVTTVHNPPYKGASPAQTAVRSASKHDEDDVDKPDNLREMTEHFDHVIVATGHFHYPSIPHWPGEQDWLDSTPPSAAYQRRIMHSGAYRGPQDFEDQIVLVLGSGPSGLDGALQIRRYARKVYHSYNPSVKLSPQWPFERKVKISHFTREYIVFLDGSSLDDVDTIYLGTGFEIHYPYLEAGGLVKRHTAFDLPGWDGMVDSNFYLRPLWEHTLSLSPLHPLTALSFIGIPMANSYRFSNAVQALLVAWTIARPDILPAREELFRQLETQEQATLAKGRPLEKLGHRMGDPAAGESEIYQTRVLEFLAQAGVPIDPALIEPLVLWRMEVRKDFWLCLRGWHRLEKLGMAQDWLKDTEGDEGYAQLTRRVIAWQKAWEKVHRAPQQEISGWD